jgi:hypothetical protein
MTSTLWKTWLEVGKTESDLIGILMILFGKERKREWIDSNLLCESQT